jgi:cytoskeletal protein RodZ
MKSCLGLIFALSLFVVVVGGGAFIWYLSYSAEFSRAGSSSNPPKAIPVTPPVNRSLPEANGR